MSMDDFIGTNEAVEKTGFTPDHIRKLVRFGKVAGKKIGRDWVIDTKSLEKYMVQERKPGKKPID